MYKVASVTSPCNFLAKHNGCTGHSKMLTPSASLIARKMWLNMPSFRAVTTETLSTQWLMFALAGVGSFCCLLAMIRR